MQAYFQGPRLDLTLAMAFGAIAALYFGAAMRYFLWDISLGKYPAPSVNPREFYLVRYHLHKKVVVHLSFCGAFVFLGLIALVLYVFANQGGQDAALLFFSSHTCFMRRIYKYATC